MSDLSATRPIAFTARAGHPVTISHGLGRQVEGWQVIWNDRPVVFSVLYPNANTANEITLVPSGDANVKLVLVSSDYYSTNRQSVKTIDAYYKDFVFGLDSDDKAVSIEDLLPSQEDQDDKYLSTRSGLLFWNSIGINVGLSLPDQQSKAGALLGTDGKSLLWKFGFSLPDQKDNQGRALFTDGEKPAWRDVVAGIYVISGDMGDTSDAMSASQSLLRHIVSRDVIFQSGLRTSSVHARHAAAESAVLGIQKNGNQIGMATFGAGQTTAVLSFVSQVSFVAGVDEFGLVAPTVPDSTLSGIYWTIEGSRS